MSKHLAIIDVDLLFIEKSLKLPITTKIKAVEIPFDKDFILRFRIEDKSLLKKVAEGAIIPVIDCIYNDKNKYCVYNYYEGNICG